jgi:hypothetical protein
MASPSVDRVQETITKKYHECVDKLQFPVVMSTPLDQTILFYTIGMPELAQQAEFAMAMPIHVEDGVDIMNNLAEAMIEQKVKLAELDGKTLDKSFLGTLVDFKVVKIQASDKMPCVQALYSRVAKERCAKFKGFGTIYQLHWPTKDGVFEFGAAQPKL